MNRIISASLSPNTESDDVWEALCVSCTPWKWKSGDGELFVRLWFSQTFHTDTVVTFNSGRTALYALLNAYDIGKGDEVIIQAFTCVAVPNSILWAGATPVYADIDGSYNIDPLDVEKKITPKTKAIIIQHTLGIPAQIEKIVSLAKKHHVWIIEDCAHALGSVYGGARLGSFGDAAFFSFGRDKSLSSVWGGVAILHSPTLAQKKKLYAFHDKAPMPGIGWIVQQLMHPLSFAVILPLYRVGIGKALLVGLQKLRLLSYPVYPEEKRGLQPSDFPGKYPNALALLLKRQIAKLDSFAKNRTDVALRYFRELPASHIGDFPAIITGAAYLRYPMHVKNPQALTKHAKAQGILLGNWFHNVIDPKGVDFDAIGYTKGSCPNAESTAAHVVNLPTRISDDDAARVIECLKTYTK